MPRATDKTEINDALRRMLERSKIAEAEWAVISPRLSELRENIHVQWEEATEEVTERECKNLLRVVRLLEKSWKRDIDDGRIARARLGEDRENVASTN